MSFGSSTLTTISYRILPSLLITLILLVTLLSCDKKEKTLCTIRFAVLTPGIGTAYLEYARDNGVFLRHGIDLKLQYFFGGGNEGNAAIASGQIDTGTYGPPVLTAIVRGLKIKIIGATSDTVSIGNILAARPYIKKVEDLRGKVIATTIKGMSPYQHVFIILEKHGLTAKDVHLRPAQGNIGLQLLKAGQADATTLSELDLAFAEKNGFAHPLDTSWKYLGTYQSGYIFVSQNLIDKRTDVVRNLMAAILESNQLASTSFDGYFSYVKEHYAKAYDSTQVRNYLKKSIDDRGLYCTVYPTAVRKYLQWMVKWGDFKQEEIDSLTDARLFDLRFLPEDTKSNKRLKLYRLSH